MTEQELALRQAVVDTITSWKGARQGSAQHREIIDIYNSYLPHPRGYAMPYDKPWCATTVSSVAITLDITDIMPVECSCTSMIELYKAMGRWVEDDAYIPQIGDVVMYYWGDGKDYATTDQTNSPNHVGIVTKVTGNSFIVTEGNMGSNSVVGDRSVEVNGRYIRGFGCPDYAKKAAELIQENGQKEKGENTVPTYKHLGDVPAWYQPSVRKVMEKGALMGSEDPDPTSLEDNVIDVSEDLCRTLTVLDRLGKLD